jgi:hypothetical protein
MASGARVESLDALRSVKTAVAKFAEETSQALGETDAELQRTLLWLETEQLAYWRLQQRNRATLLNQAREALRNKTMYKDLSGRTPLALEEKKALEIAIRRLAEAEEKIAAVKKWTPRLKNEIMIYRGGVQRLATAVQSDLPRAIGQLDGMIGSLEAYLALKDPAAEAVSGGLPAEERASPPETASGPDGEPNPPV